MLEVFNVFVLFSDEGVYWEKNIFIFIDTDSKEKANDELGVQ